MFRLIAIVAAVDEVMETSKSKWHWNRIDAVSHWPEVRWPRFPFIYLFIPLLLLLFLFVCLFVCLFIIFFAGVSLDFVSLTVVSEASPAFSHWIKRTAMAASLSCTLGHKPSLIIATLIIITAPITINPKRNGARVKRLHVEGFFIERKRKQEQLVSATRSVVNQR